MDQNYNYNCEYSVMIIIKQPYKNGSYNQTILMNQNHFLILFIY